MVAIWSILYLCVSAATALNISKRDFNKVSQGVDAISSNTKGVDNAVVAWDGQTLWGALPIYASLGSLKSSIKKATIDSAATPSISLFEAILIDGKVDSLTKDLHQLLADFKVKKDAFKKHNLVGYVKPEIAELKTLTSSFAGTLAKSIPAAGQAVARRRTETILRDYDDAASFYAT